MPWLVSRVQLSAATLATVLLIGANAARAELETVYAFRARYGDDVNGLSDDGEGGLYATAARGGAYNRGAVIRRERSGRLRVVHAFKGGAEGAQPNPEVVRDAGGNLYGTTSSEGAFGFGTAFRISACGELTTLHDFSAEEGAASRAPLLLARDGHLYGTTAGVYWNDETPMFEIVHPGAVFRLTRSGEYTTLHRFQATEGAQPLAGLMQASDGHLYGTTSAVQDPGLIHPYNLTWGTVFRITTGGEYTLLHTFARVDGGNPLGRLVQAKDGLLYGTTAFASEWQGLSTPGTVFRIALDGTFASLWTFSPGLDGMDPHTGLVEGADGKLYGTTYSSARSGWGTFFSITTAGVLTTLHPFIAGEGPASTSPVLAADGGFYLGTSHALLHIATNGQVQTASKLGYLDGARPYPGLLLGRDGAFYGTTLEGGPLGGGTIFRLTARGQLTTLHGFAANVSETSQLAVEPSALVQAADGALYGTTRGGPDGVGTLFKITEAGAFTTLHTFATASEGSFQVRHDPEGSLLVGRDNALYGVAGELARAAIVFRYDLVTNTYSEVGEIFDGQGYGGLKAGALVQSADGTLYGASWPGGANVWSGMLFRLTPSGELTRLHSFLDSGTPEGRVPIGLIEAPGGGFYGATADGGMNGGGVIYKLTTAGEIEILYAFRASDPTTGFSPSVPLTLGASGELYGLTSWAGDFEPGSAFVLRPDGTLATLATGVPGYPSSPLVQGADGLIYGATAPGTDGDPGGIVFRLDPR